MDLVLTGIGVLGLVFLLYLWGVDMRSLLWQTGTRL